jgi:hypothetical protein
MSADVNYMRLRKVIAVMKERINTQQLQTRPGDMSIIQNNGYMAALMDLEFFFELSQDPDPQRWLLNQADKEAI